MLHTLVVSKLSAVKNSPVFWPTLYMTDSYEVSRLYITTNTASSQKMLLANQKMYNTQNLNNLQSINLTNKSTIMYKILSVMERQTKY